MFEDENSKRTELVVRGSLISFPTATLFRFSLFPNDITVPYFLMLFLPPFNQICLPQGPVTLIASDLNEMRLWITALNPPLKPTTQGAAANIAAAGGRSDHGQQCNKLFFELSLLIILNADAPIVSGWLGLDGRKESWCLLRKGSIVHYKQRVRTVMISTLLHLPSTEVFLAPCPHRKTKIRPVQFR